MSKSNSVPVRALKSFSIGRRMVRRGEVLASDDAIVVGRERLFAPVGVETATAAPGESRNTPAPADDEIPAKVAEVIDWIGNDVDRAARALDAEHRSEKPRKGIVDHAQGVLDAAQAAAENDTDGQSDGGDEPDSDEA